MEYGGSDTLILATLTLRDLSASAFTPSVASCQLKEPGVDHRRGSDYVDRGRLSQAPALPVIPVEVPDL